MLSPANGPVAVPCNWDGTGVDFCEWGEGDYLFTFTHAWTTSCPNSAGSTSGTVPYTCEEDEFIKPVFCKSPNHEANWFVSGEEPDCNQCDLNGDHDGDQPGFPDITMVDTCDSDCGTVATTITAATYRVVETSPADCDGLDNDCDGLVDEGCPACAEECGPSGLTQCSGATDYRTCGDYDVDPCLEWSSPISCGSDQCVGNVLQYNFACAAGSCTHDETTCDCGCTGTACDNPDIDQNACEVICTHTWLTPAEFELAPPQEVQCCGDDAGESYYWYDQFGGDACNDITVEDCLGRPDDLTDDVCCDSATDCVLNDICFDQGTGPYDLDGDGVPGAYCQWTNRKWRDCDTSEAACISADRCGSKDWAAGGESATFGEYDTGSETECCGDDAGEFYIDTAGNTACCDDATDTVDATGACQDGVPPESICNDDIDNDGDGLVDCNDDDCCTDNANCPAYTTNEGANNRLCCLNTIDDDSDGDTDGADSQCTTPETCDNLIDDDGDGLIDCNDDDCCSDAACPQYAADEGANNRLCCLNTIDDDSDGDTDGADSQCTAPEICNNLVDDDGDGLVDCNDDDCCSDAACPQYAADEGANNRLCCLNTFDDDSDGDTDGADSQCTTPENCGNLIDDDGDGLVDCNDPDCCTDNANCPIYTTNEGANNRLCCLNTFDDDSDGDTDGADSQCTTPETCDNTIDDDGDGLVDCDDPDCCGNLACPQYAADEGATSPGGTQYLCCANGLDDDSNGDVDHDDSACACKCIIDGYMWDSVSGTTCAGDEAFESWESVPPQTQWCCGNDLGNEYYKVGPGPTQACCDDATDCADDLGICRDGYEYSAGGCTDGVDHDCDGLIDFIPDDGLADDPSCATTINGTIVFEENGTLITGRQANITATATDPITGVTVTFYTETTTGHYSLDVIYNLTYDMRVTVEKYGSGWEWEVNSSTSSGGRRNQDLNTVSADGCEPDCTFPGEDYCKPECHGWNGCEFYPLNPTQAMKSCDGSKTEWIVPYTGGIQQDIQCCEGEPVDRKETQVVGVQGAKDIVRVTRIISYGGQIITLIIDVFK